MLDLPDFGTPLPFKMTICPASGVCAMILRVSIEYHELTTNFRCSLGTLRLNTLELSDRLLRYIVADGAILDPCSEVTARRLCC